MSTSDSIHVQHLRAGFSEKVILGDVTFEAFDKEILGILGPAGVGKSTLLRTLSGWNNLLPSFWCKGQVLLQGENLLEATAQEPIQRKIPLLAQKKRLYTASVLENLLADLPSTETVQGRSAMLARAGELLEVFELGSEMEPLLDEAVVSLPIGTQRRIALVRMVAGGARFLLADEPLRDISEQEVEQVQELLRRVSAHCGVLLVTHNIATARSMCDRAALLVAGRVIEYGPADNFFQNPQDPLTQTFLQTGNCWPSEEELKAPRWQIPVVEEPGESKPTENPKSLKWILKGELGGMRMPGLISPLEDDLSSLHQHGCKALISLRYQQRLDQDILSAFGIEGAHFPIADMGVPTLEAARELCRTIDGFLERRLPTVLHCKAGLGRTGTMLACFLVYRHSTAIAAIESTRSVNPHFIQSQKQVEFIGNFERFLESSRAVVASSG